MTEVASAGMTEKGAGMTEAAGAGISPRCAPSPGPASRATAQAPSERRRTGGLRRGAPCRTQRDTRGKRGYDGGGERGYGGEGGAGMTEVASAGISPRCAPSPRLPRLRASAIRAPPGGWGGAGCGAGLRAELSEIPAASAGMTEKESAGVAEKGARGWRRWGARGGGADLVRGRRRGATAERRGSVQNSARYPRQARV